jgi:hypothetical protein
MADEHNIKSFSAADIEKYHKGLLSAKEMHAMEKAALDDPFLADAMEGYTAAGVNAEADIADLKKRLADKTSKEAKVIPLQPADRSVKSFPWLRAAVVAVLIAGAALLVYQLSFNDKKEIAQAPSASKSIDTPSQNTSEKKSASPTSADTDNIVIDGASTLTVSGNGATNTIIANKEKAQKKEEALESIDTTMAFDDNLSRQSAPATAEIKDNRGYVSLPPQYKKMAEPTIKLKEVSSKADSVSLYNYDYAKKANQQSAEGLFKAEHDKARMNFFRGQVTDSNHNALPYANITNTYDNVGTYSDVRGNFVLISPDSVLNVQVRSIGFADNNLQLKSQFSNNSVIMQGDRSLSEIIISNQKPNTTRSRTSNMVLEEPEPIDGWENYDTYLANNIRLPETQKAKQTVSGEVQLSFDINKDGDPVNITVDRSLCKSCDQEAIRLVKEGPKWKRKTRKGRTSVTVNF